MMLKTNAVWPWLYFPWKCTALPWQNGWSVQLKKESSSLTTSAHTPELLCIHP